jgi:hypothetical protein
MADDAERTDNWVYVPPMEGFRLRFEEGDKRALFEAINWDQKGLPDWVKKALGNAYWRFKDGDLKSWEEVFGKPFPGKSRKRARQRARALEVWTEVRLRINQGQPIDEHLFEQVGKKLGLGGHSTVSALYYWFDRTYQPGGIEPIW